MCYRCAALSRVRGCVVPGCAPVGTMAMLAQHVLAEAMVVPSCVRLPQVVPALDVSWPSLTLCRLDVSLT